MEEDLLEKAYRDAITSMMKKKSIPSGDLRMPTTEFQPKLPEELRPLVDGTTIVLGRSEKTHSKYGQIGLMDIGTLCEHQTIGEDYFAHPVKMDMLFPHVIFISGKRGSGKSYTLGIIAEELSRSGLGVGTVIIDPIGIYWSLREKNTNAGEVEALRKWGLEPMAMEDVRVFTPEGFYKEMEGIGDEPFSIAVSDMTVEDWCSVFDIDRFKAQGLLIEEAIEKVKHGYTADVDGERVDIPPKPANYSIGDIIQCIEYDIGITSKEEGFASATRRSVIARFKGAAKWGIFSVEGTPISHISYPNRISVIDVSHPKIGEDRRSLIAGIIARKIFEARMATSRKEDMGIAISYGSGTDIPVTWLLIDEAHLLIPHGSSTSATEALVEYAKLGRKPGCALVIATQRPAATNDDILSQTDIIISHNLALEDDMSALRRRVPAKIPAIIGDSDFIRALPVGVGIVADQKTQERAMLVQFRPRLTLHSGKTAIPTPGMHPTSTVETEGKLKEERRFQGSVAEPTTTIGPEETESGEGEEIPAETEEGESGMYLIVSSPEDRRTVAGELKGNRWLVISRTRPEKLASELGLSGDIKGIWLSSRSVEGIDTLAPTNLGKIASVIESGLPERNVILDGLDYLANYTEFQKIMRMIESIHEGALASSSRLYIFADPSVISDGDIARLKSEADYVVETPADGDTGGEDEVNVGQEAAVPVEGEGEEKREEKTEDRAELVEALKNLESEIKKLQKRIKTMEKKIESSSAKEAMKELEELRRMKEEMEKEKEEIEEALEVVEPEVVDMARLPPPQVVDAQIVETKTGEVRKGEIKPPSEIFGDIIDIIDSPRQAREVDVESTSEGWEIPRSPDIIEKRKKEGYIHIKAFRPLVGESEAFNIARSKLRKSLFGRAREAIDGMELIGIPLYVVTVRIPGGMLKKEKTFAIVLDAISGEMITDMDSGLRRTRGMYLFYGRKDDDRRILQALHHRRPVSDYDLATKLGMKLSTLRRHLTKLEKEGVIIKETTDEGAFYRLKEKATVPDKVEKARCDGMGEIEDTLVNRTLVAPLLGEKDIKDAISFLYPEAIILAIDTVYYPYWRVDISGHGGRRTIYIDARSGDVDSRVGEPVPLKIPERRKRK